MVSIFLPEKSKKMHNLPPIGKFFIKKPEEIKRRYKIRKRRFLYMKGLDYTALTVAIIGAVNWGLIGFFRLDLVALIFGNMTWLSRIIYAVVGICGLYLISVYGRISDHVLGQA